MKIIRNILLAAFLAITSVACATESANIISSPVVDFKQLAEAGLKERAAAHKWDTLKINSFTERDRSQKTDGSEFRVLYDVDFNSPKWGPGKSVVYIKVIKKDDGTFKSTPKATFGTLDDDSALRMVKRFDSKYQAKINELKNLTAGS